MDAEEFFDELQALQSQIVSARHQSFPGLVKRLFKLLEQAPGTIPQRIVWLRNLFPWERVEAEVLQSESGMGPGRIDWPDDREARLGGQLNLLFEFAEERIEGWSFAFEYFLSGTNNIDITLHEMTEGLINPALDDLTRYLSRRVDEPLQDVGPTRVPASDRIVSTNHNSAAFEPTMKGLEAVEDAVRSANNVAEEDRARMISEVQASQLLLRAPLILKMSVGFIIAALGWIATQFAEAAFAPTVEATIKSIKLLFPDLPI